MDVQRWIARREVNWRQLDTLLKQVETQGIRTLSAPQIKQMASLYRSVSADLARAQTHGISPTVIQDLQGLTTRAFSQIYQGSRRQEWRSIRQFYLWGLPALIRNTWAYLALATAMFMIPALIGWILSWQDPHFVSTLVPTELINTVRDDGELWMGSIVGVEPTASSGIMANNISVAFFALAGGMTAGIITVYILLINGLLIGAVSALVAQHNLAYPFWGFVLPHGSLELPAIFLAGAAGLLLARGIVFPGAYRRGYAVRHYSSQGVQLIFGIVPLLVIAGVIEGFFSPNPAIPDPVKYMAGLVLFTALVGYCLRQPDPRQPGLSQPDPKGST